MSNRGGPKNCTNEIYRYVHRQVDIASQRSVSPDGTRLKRDVQSIMFSCFQYIRCENISKTAKYGLGEVLWRSVDDLQ